MKKKKTIENTRKKIIVVDDLSIQLLSTRKRLKEHYEVYPAQSADILFEALENIRPELILLDLNMPDTDGYETLKKLKADSRYADIPVILFTSENKKEVLEKGKSLGAADYVTKPYSNADLIECIERYI